MRRLTQSELDNAEIIENCIIGNELSFPEKLVDVKFSNCLFETSIENVEFRFCYFDKVEWLAYNSLYINNITIFSSCKFYETEFTHCDTQSGSFHNCSFINSHFYFCSFTDSEFIKCDINNLRIRCSDLRGIKIDDMTSNSLLFDYCDLSRCTIFDSNIDIPQTVPSDGSFIAWKKAVINTDLPGEINTEHVIVKLRIPEDAQRVGITNKCRADRVEVLGFETLSGEKLPDDTDVRSWYDKDFHYKIGVVKSDSFCDKPTIVCGEGIHFFLNKTDAINYKFT
jgi:hypothetical protein